MTRMTLRRTSLSRVPAPARTLAATALLALALAGCGQKSAPETAASTTAPAAAPIAREPAAAPAVAPAAATDVKTAPAGESVADGSATSLLSPVATAVAANAPAAAAIPIPAKWSEGKNYTVLTPAQPTSVSPDKVEVVEVFWYGCGHCFHLDPTLESWKAKSKPAFAEFQRVPVMWNDVTKAHARLFYTLEALGKLDQLHAPVFREIHVNGNMLVDRDPKKTEEIQKAFLKKNGVPEADFDRTYRSFSVENKLARAEQLTRRYRVTGVPLVVVNGKYTTDVGMAGGETQLTQVINDLAASERRR
jgi:thiol:disulfide interchange protein DsbA